MADLKALFEKVGFTDVITYIQTGNVIFSIKQDISSLELALKIENAILEKYGFDVPVIPIVYLSALKVHLNKYNS